MFAADTELDLRSNRLCHLNGDLHELARALSVD